MSVHQKRETWKACVDLMVQRATANADPRDAGAYAAGTRSNIMNGPLRETAREILDEDDTLTAEQLLVQLDARQTTPATPSGSGALDHRGPSIVHIDHRRPCGHCGCYGGGGFTVPDRDPDSGLTPDAEPCPHCNVDGVRDHHQRGAATDRAELHRRYAQGIHAHRERHGTTPATTTEPIPTRGAVT